MYLQSIKSVKHMQNRSILKKSRHLGFGVFIVHYCEHMLSLSTDAALGRATHVRKTSSKYFFARANTFMT